METLFKDLTRKRKYQQEGEQSKYIRCLTTLDLSLIGIASVVGSGLYVVVGKLARDVAGPSVVLSFALAGFSALLSGLCYAEFGCRIPKAGSAYVYTYVTLGELWAFIAGWNMILEYIIACSALSRACSEYIDSLSGGVIYEFFIDKLGWWDSPALEKFPDFLALLIVILISIIIGLGAKNSSIFNNIATFINISVVLFMIFAGSYYADTRNWSSWGKFAPYGFKGVINAAGSCFFAFVGFDVIGTAGEETINPKKVIPRALMITFFVSVLSYFGISTVLTLMQPYNKLKEFAPLAGAFAERGFLAAKYVVDVGAIASITACLGVTSFAIPRIIHAIAADGLLFKWLDSINSKTHVPIRALLCGSFITGVLVLMLDLEQLIEMLSIGTLTAYTLVVVAVLLTRYQCGVESVYDDMEPNEQENDTNKLLLRTLCCKTKENESEKHKAKYTKLITSDSSNQELPEDSDNKDWPTEQSSFRASVATFVLSVSMMILCIMVSSAYNQLVLLKVWAVLVTCTSAVILVAALLFLLKQPMNSVTFPFTVPFFPALPLITLFINIFLIVNLNRWTYVRFSVWMVLGFLIYGLYGRKYSNEARSPAENNQENE